MPQTNLKILFELLTVQGQQQYGGEAVSQLDHALQCAALAQGNGASQELITACLLHDLGHLLGVDATTSNESRHEYRAVALLQGLFGPAVTEPIRLHVEAKQYLCAVNPSYWASLSLSSQQSLEQQGGAFLAEAVQRFAIQPFALDAIQLRVWDDQAKVAGAPTLNLSEFLTIAQRCLEAPNR